MALFKALFYKKARAEITNFEKNIHHTWSVAFQKYPSLTILCVGCYCNIKCFQFFQTQQTHIIISTRACLSPPSPFNGMIADHHPLVRATS